MVLADRLGYMDAKVALERDCSMKDLLVLRICNFSLR